MLARLAILYALIALLAGCGSLPGMPTGEASAPQAGGAAVADTPRS